MSRSQGFSLGKLCTVLSVWPALVIQPCHSQHQLGQLAVEITHHANKEGLGAWSEYCHRTVISTTKLEEANRASYPLSTHLQTPRDACIFRSTVKAKPQEGIIVTHQTRETNQEPGGRKGVCRAEMWRLQAMSTHSTQLLVTKPVRTRAESLV